MTFENGLDLKVYPIKNGVEIVDLFTTISVTVRDIHENGRGIIGLLDIQVPQYETMAGQQVSLSDVTQRMRVIDTITDRYTDYKLYIPNILEYAAQEALRRHTKTDDPIPENINIDPANIDVEHLFCINSDMKQRILPKYQHTTLFSQGGSGKSLIGADYIPLLYSTGIVPELGVFYPLGMGNVLVLDWETDAETHKRYIRAIKNGIEIDMNGATIHYMRLDGPITKYADYIREYIIEHEIELVIVDSQMAAMAGAFTNKSISDAEAAGVYYNILTSFKTTTLTIDHVSKSTMNTDSVSGSAYGSVVKYNRARVVFELKQSSEPGEPFIELAFVQQKNNLGMKLKPFGIRIDYDNDDDGILQGVKFSPIDLANAGKLEKVRPNWERIRDYILWERSGKPATNREIAAALELKDDIVRMTLNRYNKTFIQVGGGTEGKLWGVVTES